MKIKIKREKVYFLLASNGTVLSKFFYGRDAAKAMANKMFKEENKAYIVTTGEISFKDIDF